MDPKLTRYLSYLGVTMVMALSATYFYTTWQKGEPRWYFLVMAFAIALLLSYNLVKPRK